MRETKRDGGYAWLIVVVCFCHNVVTGTVFTSSAVYLVDWIEGFECSKAEAGFVASLYASVSAFTGIFSGPLISKFGCRPVTLVGSTVSIVGHIASVLATSAEWLQLSYGVITGIGHGLYFLPPILMVQYYFIKKRALASGISLIGHTTGAFVMMPALRFFTEKYGWRGALLIQTGIVMQIFYLSIFYQMPNIPELKDNMDEEKHPKNSDAKDQKLNDSNKRTVCGKIIDFFKDTWQLSLFKYPPFVLYYIPSVLSFIGVDIMYKFMPLKAVSCGVSKMNAAMLPSLLALSSTVSRIVTSFVANLPCVKRILMVASCIVLEGCVVVGSTLASDFTTLVISVAAFGVFIGALATLHITVVVDIVGLKRVAQAQSLMNGGLILPMMTSVSLAGLMADKTGNFNLPFYIYGSIQIVCGLVCFIIPIAQRMGGELDSQTDSDHIVGNNNTDKQRTVTDDVITMSVQSLHGV